MLNKSIRERKIQYNFTYIGNLKTKITDKLNRNKVTDTENKLTVAVWERGWGMGGRSEGIKKCRLPVTKGRGDVKYSVGDTVNNIAVTSTEPDGC